MKFIVGFVALLSYVCAYEMELSTEQQWLQFLQNETVTPETQNLILSSLARNRVKSIIKQMPCGWPKYGIPPLAPYTNADLKVHFAKSLINAIIEIIRFRFDGLDQVQIKKLQVHYVFTKLVKFHINFPLLNSTGSVLNTDTFVDAMENLGLTVRYEGSSSPMKFSFENLSIKGQFKYSMPFFVGSIKIYKFESVVALGSVRSNLGILSGEKWNALINNKIESLAPAYINGHQAEISTMIEQKLVPRVNAILKGKKVWDLMGNSNGNCVPPPAPWIEVEDFKKKII